MNPIIFRHKLEYEESYSLIQQISQHFQIMSKNVKKAKGNKIYDFYFTILLTLKLKKFHSASYLLKSYIKFFKVSQLKCLYELMLHIFNILPNTFF